MSNVYIIKLKKNNNSDIVDAFLELSNNSNGHPYLQVRTHEKSSDVDNQELLYKYISNNFSQVSFLTNDDNHECLLKYFDKIEYNTTFYFDSQSASSFTHFTETFNNMINNKIETIKYPSGHLYYFGKTVNNRNIKQPHGLGTVHYDTVASKVKYTGEFEYGKYDGAGEFFNYDNKISIKANNISNGIPTQTGVLTIKLGVKSELYDIDFNYLFESLKLTEKKDKQFFVNSDKFVNKVAKLYWTREESIKSVIFREQNINDKQLEIWNQLLKLNKKIDSLVLLNEQLHHTKINDTKSYDDLYIYTLIPSVIVLLIIFFY